MLIRTNLFTLNGTRLVLRDENREERLTGIPLAIIREVYLNNQISVEKLTERIGNEEMKTGTISVHKSRLKRIFGFAPILLDKGILSVPSNIKILKTIDNGLSMSEQLSDIAIRVDHLHEHAEELQSWIARNKKPVLASTAIVIVLGILIPFLLSPPKTAEAAPCEFVSSVNSEIYHLSGSSAAKRIKPENIVCFATRAEAERYGLRPSGSAE